MNTIGKRSILSIVLAAVMLVAMLPGNVFTVNADEVTTITQGANGDPVVTDVDGNDLTTIPGCSYDLEDDGLYHLFLEDDGTNPFSVIGTIIIPAGCVLSLSNFTLDCTKIIIEGEDGELPGGRLELLFKDDVYAGIGDTPLELSHGANLFVEKTSQLPDYTYYYLDDSDMAALITDEMMTEAAQKNGFGFWYSDDQYFTGWILTYVASDGPNNQGGEEAYDPIEDAKVYCTQWAENLLLAAGDIYDATAGAGTGFGDGVTDENDIRYAFAHAILNDEQRFGDLFEIIKLNSPIVRNYDWGNEESLTAYQNVMSDLFNATTATIDTDNRLTVVDKNGVSYDLQGYTVTFTMNMDIDDEHGEELTFTATGYLIDDADFDDTSYQQVIIKVGDKFFIRDACGDPNGNDPTHDGTVIEGSTNTAIYIFEDFDSKEDVTVFGNGVNVWRELTDETTTDSYIFSFGVSFGRIDDRDLRLGETIAVLKKDYTGILISGNGEENTPGGWGKHSDFNLAESSEGDVKYTVYFGYSSLDISPLNDELVGTSSVDSIISVTIGNDIPQEAVSVTTNDDGTYTVNFLSDYYNEVPLIITYKFKDGTTVTRNTMIYRAGIVLTLAMTPGSEKYLVGIEHESADQYVIGADGKIYDRNSFTGTEEFSLACYATYYYPTASGATEGNVSLYVTIEYDDGTSETRIIDSQLFIPPTQSINDPNTTFVACSDYVIHITKDGGKRVTKVTALAVNKADESGRFEGAKLGAGKGITMTVEYGDRDPMISYN